MFKSRLSILLVLTIGFFALEAPLQVLSEMMAAGPICFNSTNNIPEEATAPLRLLDKQKHPTVQTIFLEKNGSKKHAYPQVTFDSFMKLYRAEEKIVLLQQLTNTPIFQFLTTRPHSFPKELHKPPQNLL